MSRLRQSERVVVQIHDGIGETQSLDGVTARTRPCGQQFRCGSEGLGFPGREVTLRSAAPGANTAGGGVTLHKAPRPETGWTGNWISKRTALVSTIERDGKLRRPQRNTASQRDLAEASSSRPSLRVELRGGVSCFGVLTATPI